MRNQIFTNHLHKQQSNAFEDFKIENCFFV